MTARVIIKNPCTVHTLAIRKVDRSPVGVGVSSAQPDWLLKPGEEMETYVWDTRSLTVEEARTK